MAEREQRDPVPAEAGPEEQQEVASDDESSQRESAETEEEEGLTALEPQAEDQDGAEHVEEKEESSLAEEAVDKPGTPTKDKQIMDRRSETPDEAPRVAISVPRTPSWEGNRQRTDSQSTTATMATGPRGSARSTRSSMVFVVTALETIAASKDAKQRKALNEAAQRALAAVRTAQGDASQIDPEIMFEPLKLATEAHTTSVVTTALDCIGKLISYSYFSIPQPAPDPNHPQQTQLIERAIDAICNSFQVDATPEVQMQIIKSLLAAILNDKIVVHGNGLLKSVRQIYNIFLLSKSSANQQIAQGTLTQMANTVFERVEVRLAAKAARESSSKSSLIPATIAEDQAIAMDVPAAGGDGEVSDSPDATESVVRNGDTPVMTLKTFETRRSFDDAKIADSAPTTVTQAKRSPAPRQTLHTPTVGQHASSTEEDEEDEIHIRDAFLLFRAMCKLGTKVLRPEDAADIKSQGMRSKLLSLHIIHTALFNHSSVFTSPYSTIRASSNGEATQFTRAINQYLCLSLSRNATSVTPRVFEVSAEIFWLMIRYLRAHTKRESEVFFREVYLAILEKRAAPWWQKSYIIQHVFGRIVADPRILVEIYLNYDCDRQSADNFCQKIIEHMSRLAAAPISVTPLQQQAYLESAAKNSSSLNDWRDKGTLPPSLATANLGGPHEQQQHLQGDFPHEYALKIQSLEALVDTLKSMVEWSQQPIHLSTAPSSMDGRVSAEDGRLSMDTRHTTEASSRRPTSAVGEDGVAADTDSPLAEDDPAELEKVKQHKTALNRAVQEFNFKPKRGVKTLIDQGFIPSSSPEDIARFLLKNERIDKASLGEFLGEGDEYNIKIMHAFLDQMDFSRTRFVDALRRFLQSFRLPGEAQKIDRLMLKFAERYTTGNPSAFANADTAYVLGYSVIMLNTDQHSAQVKQRMAPEDFIKNNRGINDNADLPEDYLRGIFEEIQNNEIVLDTERERAANLGFAPQPIQPGGLVSALANVGRDLQREAYVAASDEMSARTELLFKNILRQQRRIGAATTAKVQGSRFITARDSRHVGPMFEMTWMSFLTALSGSVQESQNIETIHLCIKGLKLAIRIACLFDLEDPRQAFVTSLAQSTSLYNLSEMKSKNMDALKALLDIAYTEGNLLKESWREVLTCISQLDRFQLISSGVSEGAVPDMLRHSAFNSANPTGSMRRGAHGQRRGQIRGASGGTFHSDIAEESRSVDMIRGVDRIFTNTANLSGDAIVHFVRALTQVSWQEIQSSGQSADPRIYSLTKLVEVSEYNMLRVRFEWTSIWQVLGQHFIDVGCHNNTTVVNLALNSLRQLSMRFMEIEELPGFKFQKDFLKPFEFILGNASQATVKDLVLRCLIQMIQAKGDKIRSGWRTMFGVFTVAAREPYESIVNLAFDNVTQVYNERFGVVISQGAFADLVVCLTEFSKNQRFQKKSLQAIETLKASVPKMLRTPECSLSLNTDEAKKDAPQAEGLPKQPSRQTQEEQFWFPVLFAFHDVLMTGEDLEVRSRALNYLFDTLMRYGGSWPREFWDTLWRQLFYPIFVVLKDRKAINQEAVNHEELSVWLSTTLIQALRNMISLFTHFFDSLEYMLDRFLDLLALCICQENDTLARIGSNCLQQLILQNVMRFSENHWEMIVRAFVDLFARTEAKELFSPATTGGSRRASETTENATLDIPKGPNALTSQDDGAKPNGSTDEVSNGPRRARTRTITSLSDIHETSPSPRTKKSELEDFAESGSSAKQQQAPVVVTAAKRRYFNQIITKCVLQLLMIETVSELFNNDSVYSSIPSHLLLRLMSLLKKSYHFAKRFNEDRDLRTRLFREGFMKQPPNLLKQESGSASVYVLILLRMYADTTSERIASRPETEAALIPLCSDILESYIELDEETHQRNIVTWRPVVVDVLDGFSLFAEQEFGKLVDMFAPLVLGLMNREMTADLQRAVQGFWARVCESRLGIRDFGDLGGPVAASPRRGSVFARRERVGRR
ncbi:hypothetical protein K470DRAFT_256750 [Piedraia hortae CBS 480.64]|uniref:SEC7 domain-containing protein n=1 Tax=Piedraia hortae CBS 480.64 TaxID=1314780 RepID=A0A6A7C3K5_9PEZI|nr:hypothetical protein K470DRAFT_256750 [Piedraia hortae CBS 480.64]